MNFVQKMLLKYAPRYVDKKGRTHINANLGEFHRELNKPNPKQIAHILAFGIEATLAREKDEDECVTNHMDPNNHSVGYHLDTTVLDAVRSMANSYVTEDSFFKNVVHPHIALADTHTRSGTIGKGSCFEEFKKEVNDDPALSKFCSHAKLKLVEKLALGGSSYAYCKPIIIDMLLGIYNWLLYALFVKAETGETLFSFVASFRTLGFLKTDGLKPIVSPLLIAGFGAHPNSAEIWLTLRGVDEVQQMDVGMALSLRPIDGCVVEYEDDDGNLKSTKVKWGPTDSFLRTYNFRKYEKSTGDQLKQLEKELRSINKKRAKVRDLREKQ